MCKIYAILKQVKGDWDFLWLILYMRADAQGKVEKERK